MPTASCRDMLAAGLALGSLAGASSQGGHMGRNRETTDEAIFSDVTLPWIMRRLGPQPRRAASLAH